MSDAAYEIQEGLGMFYRDGDIVEMRVVRNQEDKFSPTISGFFNDLEKLARAIQQVNETYERTIFTTLNPLKQSWMAVNNRCYIGSKALQMELTKAGLPLEPRMKKVVSWESGSEHYSMRTADDDDVLMRRWMLIDVDAGQPAGFNSTDEEHVATLEMANSIVSFLQERGFPKSGLVNSGNGHHVYVRVDLENTQASDALVQRFLKAMSQRFDGRFGKAHVDIAMYNAGRITKAAGTMVYKGPDTDERPQRRSRVIETASKRFAMEDQLTEIAAEYVLTKSEAATDFSRATASDAELNYQVEQLLHFLDFYDIDHQSPRQDDNHVTVPVLCPNKEQHTMDGGELEAIATVRTNGALGFCCQHSHCQHFRGWKQFKEYMSKTTGKSYEPAPESAIVF